MGRFLAAIFALLLSACASPLPLEDGGREKIFDDFRRGNVALDCRVSCSSTWGWHADDVHALYQAGLWEDLAIKVSSIRYAEDLGWVYLALAAEELGFPDAAERYYRLAKVERLGFNRCDFIFNQCDGLDLDALLEERLAYFDTIKSEKREQVAAVKAEEEERRAKLDARVREVEQAAETEAAPKKAKADMAAARLEAEARLRSEKLEATRLEQERKAKEKAAAAILVSSGERVVIGRWCNQLAPNRPDLKVAMMIVVSDAGQAEMREHFFDGSSREMALNELGRGLYAVPNSSSGDKYRISSSTGELDILDNDGLISIARRLENTPGTGDCVGKKQASQRQAAAAAEQEIAAVVENARAERNFPKKQSGLGVTASQFRNLFKGVYSFEDAPLSGGRARVVGQALDGAILELIGPPGNLTEVGLAVFAKSDGDNTNISVMMLGVLHLVIPDTPGMADDLTEMIRRLARKKGGAELKQYGANSVTMTHVPSLGLVSISVKRRT